MSLVIIDQSCSVDDDARSKRARSNFQTSFSSSKRTIRSTSNQKSFRIDNRSMLTLHLFKKKIELESFSTFETLSSMSASFLKRTNRQRTKSMTSFRWLTSSSSRSFSTAIVRNSFDEVNALFLTSSQAFRAFVIDTSSSNLFRRKSEKSITMSRDFDARLSRFLNANVENRVDKMSSSESSMTTMQTHRSQIDDDKLDNDSWDHDDSMNEYDWEQFLEFEYWDSNDESSQWVSKNWIDVKERDDWSVRDHFHHDIIVKNEMLREHADYCDKKNENDCETKFEHDHDNQSFYFRDLRARTFVFIWTNQVNYFASCSILIEKRSKDRKKFKIDFWSRLLKSFQALAHLKSSSCHQDKRASKLRMSNLWRNRSQAEQRIAHFDVHLTATIEQLLIFNLIVHEKHETHLSSSQLFFSSCDVFIEEISKISHERSQLSIILDNDSRLLILMLTNVYIATTSCLATSQISLNFDS